jgi:hypothetical protein
MGMIQAFLPFIGFALIDRWIGSTTGLVAGAVIGTAIIVRDCVVLKRSLKLLEVGTVILFAGMACYAILAEPAWTVVGVRLRVDTGLLLIVLASIAFGRPFTAQYAREQLAPERWDTPQFRRTNMIISAAWAVVFAVLVSVELAMVSIEGLPPRFGVWAIIAALVGGFRFSQWYPERVRLASREMGGAASR